MRAAVGYSVHWKDAHKRIVLYCKAEMLLKKQAALAISHPTHNVFSLTKTRYQTSLKKTPYRRKAASTSSHAPSPAGSSVPPVLAAALPSSQHRTGRCVRLPVRPRGAQPARCQKPPASWQSLNRNYRSAHHFNYTTTLYFRNE